MRAYSERDTYTMKSKKGRSKKECSKILVNNSNTQYPVIGIVAHQLDWGTTNSYDGKWHIYWTDSGRAIEKVVSKAKSYQRVNHFPGMVNIYRKNYLSRSISRMQRLVSQGEYSFYPKTWILPYDLQKCCSYLDKGNGENCVIIKPSGGAQGKGIFLSMSSSMLTEDQNLGDCIVQSYITRPLLIDGYKFDLRIYVLVVSCDPLRILIFREGLVRLCTSLYCVPDASNIDCTFMHLTNYAVNKHNSAFVQNNDPTEDKASKRSLSWFQQWLTAQGYNFKVVWRRISDVVVKTLISAHAPLQHLYRSSKVSADNKSPFTCFEILGFDILLTDDLKPVLLEVNHTPSFRTDSHVDLRVKEALITNTYKLLNVSLEERDRYYARCTALSQIRLYGSTLSGDKEKDRAALKRENMKQEWQRYLENEEKHIGDYELIYPTDYYENQPTCGRQEVYDNILEKSYVDYYCKGAASLDAIDNDEDEVAPMNNTNTDEGDVRTARSFKISVPMTGGSSSSSSSNGVSHETVLPSMDVSTMSSTLSCATTAISDKWPYHPTYNPTPPSASSTNELGALGHSINPVCDNEHSLRHLFDNSEYSTSIYAFSEHSSSKVFNHHPIQDYQNLSQSQNYHTMPQSSSLNIPEVSQQHAHLGFCPCPPKGNAKSESSFQTRRANSTVTPNHAAKTFLEYSSHAESHADYTAPILIPNNAQSSNIAPDQVTRNTNVIPENINKLRDLANFMSGDFSESFHVNNTHKTSSKFIHVNSTHEMSSIPVFRSENSVDFQCRNWDKGELLVSPLLQTDSLQTTMTSSSNTALRTPDRVRSMSSNDLQENILFPHAKPTFDSNLKNNFVKPIEELHLERLSILKGVAERRSAVPLPATTVPMLSGGTKSESLLTAELRSVNDSVTVSDDVHNDVYSSTFMHNWHLHSLDTVTSTNASNFSTSIGRNAGISNDSHGSGNNQGRTNDYGRTSSISSLREQYSTYKSNYLDYYREKIR